MTGDGPAPDPDARPVRTLPDKLKRALASTGEALPQHVVHGGLWQVLTRAGSRALDLLQLVVVARLLVPEEFGLFGIALLTQQTLDILLKFGIEKALIQREEGTEAYLDTAWTLKVLRSLVVAGCLLVVAPWIAAFFRTPEVTPLIRAFAGIALLQGFRNIGVIYFRKELEFRRQFALHVSGALASAVVAIVLAWILRSVWALVAGVAASAVVRLVMSYVLHPYRPRAEMNLDRARDLWGFGKWLFGSTTLVYASTQGDDILLGRWLGAAPLGIYQVGYRISNSVATEITNVIAGVTFPAYAKLQGAAGKLREAFLATFSLTALGVVPLAAAICLFIAPFVRHVIGVQWEAAVGPVRILAVAGLVRAFSGCWGPLYLAQARTDRAFWKQAVRTVLTLGPAYPLTMTYGVEGMALAVLAGIGGAFACDLFWRGGGGEAVIEVRAVARELVGPVLATLGASVVVVALGGLSGPGLAAFLGLAAGYVGVYVVLVALIERTGWSTGWSRAVGLLDRM